MCSSVSVWLLGGLTCCCYCYCSSGCTPAACLQWIGTTRAGTTSLTSAFAIHTMNSLSLAAHLASPSNAPSSSSASFASQAECTAQLRLGTLCGERGGGDCGLCGASSAGSSPAWCVSCRSPALELFGLTIRPEDLAARDRNRTLDHPAEAQPRRPPPPRLPHPGARPLPMAPAAALRPAAALKAAAPLFRVGTGSIDLANVEHNGEPLGRKFEVWAFVGLCSILAYAQYPLFSAKGSTWANLLTFPWVTTMVALMLAWNEYPLNWVPTLPHRALETFRGSTATMHRASSSIG